MYVKIDGYSIANIWNFERRTLAKPSFNGSHYEVSLGVLNE